MERPFAFKRILMLSPPSWGNRAACKGSAAGAAPLKEPTQSLSMKRPGTGLI